MMTTLILAALCGSLSMSQERQDSTVRITGFDTRGSSGQENGVVARVRCQSEGTTWSGRLVIHPSGAIWCEGLPKEASLALMNAASPPKNQCTSVFSGRPRMGRLTDRVFVKDWFETSGLRIPRMMSIETHSSGRTKTYHVQVNQMVLLSTSFVASQQ